METRNQSVFGHVKDDLSDIKTMLKMITAKLEKQSPALESTLANNGFFTYSGQASHLMGVTVQISGSSVHGGSAHSLGGIQLLSPANPLGHEPVHGNTHFHYPMVSNTFSNAPSPEFNHLQQLSTHNGNYSNSIPSIEYNMLKFDGGEDVRSWISECERVFILENTPQNCKVQRATMALEGSAFIWHRVYTHKNIGISWQDYSQAIIKRFDKRKYAIKECSGEESCTPILSVRTPGMDASSSSTSNENEAGPSYKVGLHMFTHPENEEVEAVELFEKKRESMPIGVINSALTVNEDSGMKLQEQSAHRLLTLLIAAFKGELHYNNRDMYHLRSLSEDWDDGIKMSMATSLLKNNASPLERREVLARLMNIHIQTSATSLSIESGSLQDNIYINTHDVGSCLTLPNEGNNKIIDLHEMDVANSKQYQYIRGNIALFFSISEAPMDVMSLCNSKGVLKGFPRPPHSWDFWSDLLEDSLKIDWAIGNKINEYLEERGEKHSETFSKRAIYKIEVSTGKYDWQMEKNLIKQLIILIWGWYYEDMETSFDRLNEKFNKIPLDSVHDMGSSFSFYFSGSLSTSPTSSSLSPTFGSCNFFNQGIQGRDVHLNGLEEATNNSEGKEALQCEEVYENIYVPSPQRVFKTSRCIWPTVSSVLERFRQSSPAEYTSLNQSCPETSMSSPEEYATERLMNEENIALEDYSNHLFAKEDKDINPKDWIKKIQQDWGFLEKGLPKIIFVQTYEKLNLSRVVIARLAGKLEIIMKPNQDNEIATIRQNGKGMTKGELNDFIKTIAQNGTSNFLEAINANQDLGTHKELIGQFCLGFHLVFPAAGRDMHNDFCKKIFNEFNILATAQDPIFQYAEFLHRIYEVNFSFLSRLLGFKEDSPNIFEEKSQMHDDAHKILVKVMVIIWSWYYKDAMEGGRMRHPGSWNWEWKIAWKMY